MATEIPAPEPQPDGVYPRVNAELLGTGEYLDMIVSVVGRFHGTPTQLLHRYMQDPSSAGVTFLCCDGKTIELTGELEEDALPDVGAANDMAVEIIGLAQSRNKVVVFVIRPLSTDMDMAVYNKMVQVQRDPRFAKYFTHASSKATYMTRN